MELISLLKHQPPVAYATREVHTMDQLRDVPTAPLNKFEQDAVEFLRVNFADNVVVDEADDAIQIVGALRASDSCKTWSRSRSWHTAAQGAFTYRLTRVRGEMRKDSQTGRGLRRRF